jgi:hypothetical protein
MLMTINGYLIHVYLGNTVVMITVSLIKKAFKDSLSLIASAH